MRKIISGILGMVMVLNLIYCSGTTPAAPASLTEDIWYRTARNGVEVGYVHKQNIIGSKEHPGLAITEMESKMGFSVRGQKQEPGGIYEYVETLEGRPVSFKYLRSGGMSGGLIIEGNIKDDKLHLTVETRDGKKEHTIAWDKNIKFPYAITKLYQANGLVKGTSFTYLKLLPETTQIVEVTTEVLGPEITRVGDEEMTLNKLKISYDTGNISTEMWEWCNERGQMVKFQPTTDEVMVRQDKEKAQALNYPDVWQFMAIARLESPFPGLPKVKSALLRLEFTDREMLEKIPWEADNRQTIEKKEDGAIFLRITQPTLPEAGKLRAIPITDTALAEYLTGNKYLESDDPLIIKTAREIVGDETDAWKAAYKLAVWVNQKMKKGNNPGGFVTARQALNDMTGVCTEHSVLLAALARSVGIPSRVCFGMMYYEGGFYVHMWTQVYVGDWVSIDAINGLVNFGATHITLEVSSLNGVDNLDKLMGAAMQFGGWLKIKIVE